MGRSTRARAPSVPPRNCSCQACEEGFLSWHCEQCGLEVDSHCRECHAEIRHGSIGPPPRPRSSGGGIRVGGNCHEDEDMNRRAD